MGGRVSTPEQYLEKLNYSIEFIQKKQDAIADRMANLVAGGWGWGGG